MRMNLATRVSPSLGIIRSGTGVVPRQVASVKAMSGTNPSNVEERREEESKMTERKRDRAAQRRWCTRRSNQIQMDLIHTSVPD